MPFRDTMDRILPPTANGTTAHVTGNYGEPRGVKGPHGGTDMNYVGGQTGVNLQYPNVHSPIDGVVIFVGGQYGTVSIRDANGIIHQILHTNSQSVTVGQRISAGDVIGTMGGTGPTGPTNYDRHVHYQMRDAQGRPINPQAWWDNGPNSTNGGGTGSGGATRRNRNGAPGGPGDSGADSGARGAPPPRRDPLVLDIDGDGIETLGVVDGVAILFDHDGDGVKTGSGWVKSDDGLLVLDRNGNGTIDSGRELFGVDTIKSNGQFAADGFDALRDLDSNQDGKIDANDSIFSSLRVWRDLNQDGVSQENELSSLDAVDISAIYTNSTATRVDLGNGNIQTASGSFARSDGSLGLTGETDGSTGNLDLLVNTFYSEFTSHITLTEQAISLPTLHGSGRVRDLDEAISLSPILGNFLQIYLQQDTKQEQIDLLDELMQKWVDTSDLKPLKTQAEELAGSGVTLTYTLAGLSSGTPEYDEFLRKLGVVERLMGFTYGGAFGEARFTPLDGNSGLVTVSLSQEQIANISLAYDRFRSDIYESLVLVSRFKSYVDAIEADLMGDAATFTNFEAQIALAIESNPQQGISDLVEFISAYGYGRLEDLGWDARRFLATKLEESPEVTLTSQESSGWTIGVAPSGSTGIVGTLRSDLLVAADTNDTVEGGDGDDNLVGRGGDDFLLAGNGDDIVSGGSGHDELNGGAGADWLNGGAGDDFLSGGAGADTYYFGRGSGNDRINNSDDEARFHVVPISLVPSQSSEIETIYDGTVKAITVRRNTDVVELGPDISPQDVVLSRVNNDLILTIVSTGETLTIEGHFFSYTTLRTWTGASANYYVTDRPYEIGSIQFADGTVWSSQQFSAAGMRLTGLETWEGTNSGADDLFGGAGNDWLSGLSGDDDLFGGDGNDLLEGGGSDWGDWLYGEGGDDTLDGGPGRDYLSGGFGSDTYLFGRGSGNDLVRTEAADPMGAKDTVLFGAGISPTDLSFGVLAGSLGATLVVKINGTSDELAIENFFVPDPQLGTPVGYFKFPDGTIWDYATIIAQIPVVDQTITGSSHDQELLVGGSGNDTLSGLGGDDILYGGDGNDTLNGGTGGDLLYGGRGNDVLVVDNLGDVVIEKPSEGTDTVQSSIAFTLGDNVENLTLTGSSAIAGTGNALDNVLTGNSGANVLTGGAGDDTYVVGAGDTTIESSGGGTDTVRSSITWALAPEVENLILTGSSAINGTGNAVSNVITGNSGSNILDGGAGADIMIGGTGNDIYVVDSVGDVVTENAGEGTDLIQTGITLSLASYANVENLTLTGSSAINGTGSATNNTITGNVADNILDGGSGTDTLVGGAGNDTYYVDVSTDVITEGTSAGTDLVYSSATTYTLAANVENLTLLGTANISGTGNTGANVIRGNSGDNMLDGGTGSDTLIGGAGNDTYTLDVSTDVVTENLNEGIDTINAAFTALLVNYANVENLTLTGTSAINATGTIGDNVLTGNSANNTLTGGDGNDTLDGKGGADTMVGGKGNDIYFVDVSTDVVTEASGEGTDTVNSVITYSLASLANVENLTLIGTSAINGTGNGANNVIIGNGAANSLDGGSGADSLIGGAGNDTYTVDSASDVIIENLNEGTDLVNSSVTYNLSANVENLTLTGTAAINGTGNDIANTITGNSGNNVIDGGAGMDTLVGGAGNDTYYVDVSTDVITEGASAGTDLVYSSATTYTLAANVENLTLTGTANINGTGNTGANVITGNAGNNVLDGGTGTDSLIGGAGDDIYFLDVSTDVVTEASNGGTDTVNVGFTASLVNYANVENMTLTGTGAINATGNAGNNALRGNSAANTLTGGAGNDSYQLGRGSGSDIIVENDATVGNTDTALFDAGISVDQLWFTKSGNNLVVTVIGTGDQFTVKDWYLGSQYHVEQFKTSDGKVLLDSQVQNLVNAMASFSPPAAGQTTLPTNYATSLAPVFAANWH